jgi:hypothetical protein
LTHLKTKRSETASLPSDEDAGTKTAASGPGRLVLRPQAPRAQVETFRLAIDIHGGGVDVRGPAPVGVALGMADIMAEKRRFSAQIAFQFEGSWIKYLLKLLKSYGNNSNIVHYYNQYCKPKSNVKSD